MMSDGPTVTVLDTTEQLLAHHAPYAAVGESSAETVAPFAVEHRAERAADRTGLDAAQIERLPFDLSALEGEGLFVNVDARGFGLLDRRLDWHTLGITLPREMPLALRPPRCGLLPDRHRLPLLRPAARAHAALHRYSYRFQLTETLFETPSYRWVPWRAFETFEREFTAIQRSLAAAQAALLDEYEAVREEVLEAFHRLATESARRLTATGHAAPEGFADAVAAGALGAFPTPDEIHERLTLRYRVGVILLGSEMLAEQRKSRALRQELESAAAEDRLVEQQRAARSRLVQQELWADEERLRRQLAAEEEERRREAAIKERLRTLKLEAARERLADALSPLEEGARQLHAAIYEASSAIRASLQKNGTLRGASAKQARELTRWFRLMNWQGDTELECLLGELERLARQPRPSGNKRRDPGPLDQVLGDIIDRCYADARALIEPHRMGAIEL